MAPSKLPPPTLSSSQYSQSARAAARSNTQHRRHYVKHDYHDFANEPDDPAKTPIRRRKGGVNTPFPIILHRVMTQVEDDGYGHIFGWQPHGRAFLIHKPKEFNEFILPKYFQQNKLTSFQRQLNLYGFNRLTRGLDAAGYYHEYFLRDREYLAKRMMRQRIKGTKIKGAASPEAEPDFYAMPYVKPTIDESVATKARSTAAVAAASALALSTRKAAPAVVKFAMSQETPIVSGDDMSHGSVDESDATSQQEVGVKARSSALVVSTVPSMTDYKPIGGRPTSDTPVVSDLSQIMMDASDPADALLMDLHKMAPLEDFSYGLSSTVAASSSGSRRTLTRNVTIEVIEPEDETLHAMEEDQVLSEMLHHVLDA